MDLAILGGSPVRTGEWPPWPEVTDQTLDLLIQAAKSGRWSVTGLYQATECFDRRFGDAFARFTDTHFCIPVASGTAGLMISLEAAGVGVGDEVIIPGLTWVANAATVLGVNAVPVLTDVDQKTICIDPECIESNITSRTRAIVVVHIYSAIADIENIVSICRRHGLVLIEDCAHSHGAQWCHRHVGSFGELGVFSMHNSKLLTSGEGGAVVTNSINLCRRLEQLRADGRMYRETMPVRGEMALIQAGELMGNNRCFSEFQAAVLLDQLEKLEEQNARRKKNAEYLSHVLRSIGFGAQETSGGTTKRTYYCFPVSIDKEHLRGLPIDTVAKALSAELGVGVKPTYAPLNASPIYKPWSRRRFQLGSAFKMKVDPSRFELPRATAVHSRFVTFPHQVLLGSRHDMDLIAEAFDKLTYCVDQIRKLSSVL